MRPASLPGRRIGILGGSFDPPHIGHFICARRVAEQLHLDRILLIPANIQPHKPEGAVASASDRFQMTAAAARLDLLFKASGLEINRGGISYSVDTLEELSSLYGVDGAELTLILGADAAADLPRWRAPERLFDLASIAVMTRPQASFESLPPDWRKRLITVATPSIEISSTEVRRRIREGLPTSWMIPKPVERIIRERRLYR